MVEYLIKLKKDSGRIDLNAVSTLSFSFKIENYKNLISVDLIEILFDSLTKVKETNIMQNLIIFIKKQMI